MKMRLGLVILLVALVSTVTACADLTVTYTTGSTPNTVALGDTLTNWTQAADNYLVVPEWNPASFAGDYLAGVSITLSGDIDTDGSVFNAVNNSTTTPGTLLYNSGISGYLDLYGPSDEYLTTINGSAQIGTNPSQNVTLNASPGPGNTYSSSLSSTATPVVWTAAPGQLSEFTGNGTLNLPTDATGSSVISASGGNITGSAPVYEGASATITYTYDTQGPSVPEPGSLGLGAMCLLGLGFWRRRKR
jgi:MYXO-CTERM domain-containing protein